MTEAQYEIAWWSAYGAARQLGQTRQASEKFAYAAVEREDGGR